MSQRIYNYDKCFAIAKTCNSSSEFQATNGSAYNAARSKGWIKDYTWFVRNQHSPYTYEEVYEIAKGYTCSSDFQKGNGSAYGKARANNWIKDYYWFVRKHRAPYTYDECYEIAKNYNTRLGLARGNVGAYKAALNHGWLDDYDWFESPQNPYNYWTKERVVEESKKYRTRGEFHDFCGTAYGKARINGWLDELTWLKDDRIDFSNDRVDCVYAYEFKEYNAVYVGRTLVRRKEERDKEHIFTDTDAVHMFAKEKNIPVPDMIILEDNLTLSDGVEKEGYYLECYRKKGWRLLNRMKTGGIGLLARNKWTEKSCRLEALKYKTRGDYALLSPGAYDVSRRNGWLDSYSWFDIKQKPKGYWDDYDNCYNAALGCKNVSEFHKRSSVAYVKAKKNNWIKDYTWFNTKRVAHNKKWDYYSVYEEAKKYKSRVEFEHGARGAYKVACQNGWMDLYDWFEDTHVLRSRKLKLSWIQRKGKVL